MTKVYFRSGKCSPEEIISKLENTHLLNADEVIGDGQFFDGSTMISLQALSPELVKKIKKKYLNSYLLPEEEIDDHLVVKFKDTVYISSVGFHYYEIVEYETYLDNGDYDSMFWKESNSNDFEKQLLKNVKKDLADLGWEFWEYKKHLNLSNREYQKVLQKEIYSDISRTLTDFENGILKSNQIIEEFYSVLVKIQNSWENMGLKS